MHEKPGHFDNVKSDAISQAKVDGVSDPKELEKIGNEAKKAAIEKVGQASEKRYERYIKQYKRVRTNKASPDEDRRGIDYWETYHETLQLIDMPVQIKSGWKDVEAFRQDPRYVERDGIFLVFNVGPSITQEMFDEQHSKEIARVRKLLDEHKIHFV